MKTHSPVRNTVILLSMAALAWTGCSKEQVLDEIAPPAVPFSFTYPAIPVALDSAVVAGPGLTLELDSTVLGSAAQANGYLPGQITGLVLNKARLHFATPVNSFYNSFKSVTVFIQASETYAVQVAKLDPVPNGAQTLLLGLDDVDVLDLVRSNHAKLILRVEFDGPIAQGTTHMLSIGAKATVEL